MKKNVLSVRMYDTTFDKLRQLEYLEKEKEKKKGQTRNRDRILCTSARDMGAKCI